MQPIGLKTNDEFGTDDVHTWGESPCAGSTGASVRPAPRRVWQVVLYR